jgi:hypothetical protein
MDTTVKTRHGTPLYADTDVIVEFEVLQPMPNGALRKRAVRVWLDREDQTKLRVNADDGVAVLPGLPNQVTLTIQRGGV